MPITLFPSPSLLQVLLYVLLFLLLLPLLALLVLTNAGFQSISDVLVTQNATAHIIQIHTINGKIINFTAKTSWPLYGIVTLAFGQPDPPYQPIHTGIDIANPNGLPGDPIHPFAKGTVLYAGEDLSGYGKHVIIDNGDHVTSLYAHMETMSTQVGSTVDIHDVIGYVGQTGWATGPHLHFQINVYGIPVNPRTFIEGNP